MKYIFVTILLCFSSCDKKITETKSKTKSQETKNESVKPQSSAFDDFIKDQTPVKAFVNQDSIPDYIFYGIQGSAHFFDGKTKKQINYEVFISKAGPDPELKIVNVNCNDNQNEFILQSAGGGTLGNYHGMDIMKYNPKTHKISSIFSRSISSFHWEEDTEILDDVYYIDILYKKNNECIDTIKVYQGEFIGKKESYSLNIRPKKLIEKYHFNKKTEKFEKSN